MTEFPVDVYDEKVARTLRELPGREDDTSRDRQPAPCAGHPSTLRPSRSGTRLCTAPDPTHTMPQRPPHLLVTLNAFLYP